MTAIIIYLTTARIRGKINFYVQIYEIFSENFVCLMVSNSRYVFYVFLGVDKHIRDTLVNCACLGVVTDGNIP